MCLRLSWYAVYLFTEFENAKSLQIYLICRIYTNICVGPFHPGNILVSLSGNTVDDKTVRWNNGPKLWISIGVLSFDFGPKVAELGGERGYIFIQTSEHLGMQYRTCCIPPSTWTSICILFGLVKRLTQGLAHCIGSSSRHSNRPSPPYFYASIDSRCLQKLWCLIDVHKQQFTAMFANTFHTFAWSMLENITTAVTDRDLTPAGLTPSMFSTHFNTTIHTDVSHDWKQQTRSPLNKSTQNLPVWCWQTTTWLRDTHKHTRTTFSPEYSAHQSLWQCLPSILPALFTTSHAHTLRSQTTATLIHMYVYVWLYDTTHRRHTPCALYIAQFTPTHPEIITNLQIRSAILH